MDDAAIRLRCLELAKPLFPAGADTEAMVRAAERLWTFVTAQPATASAACGKPTELSTVKPVEAPVVNPSVSGTTFMLTDPDDAPIASVLNEKLKLNHQT